MERIIGRFWSTDSLEDFMCYGDIMQGVLDNGSPIIACHGGDNGECQVTLEMATGKTVVCCHMNQVSQLLGYSVLDNTITTTIELHIAGEQRMENYIVETLYEIVVDADR